MGARSTTAKESKGGLTIRISYKKTVVQTVERDVPYHFGYDDSPRGKVVDILTKDSSSYHGRSLRHRIFDDNGDDVERCINELKQAYVLADEIMEAVCSR